MKYGFFALAVLILPLSSFATDFSELEALFSQWRKFETPPLLNSAPDYRQATFKSRKSEWTSLKKKLLAMDKTNWTTVQQADWFVVLAELNGYEFNEKVLKPWQRDPAFYKQLWMHQSDVPAHEGPTPHFTTEWWTYSLPLDEKSQATLITDLSRIPPFQIQARENLTGNAKELWIAGIRDIRSQLSNLKSITEDITSTRNQALINAHLEAIQSTGVFISWLEQESKSKTGPSGLGKAHYSWYQQNVHLVPMDWAEEERLLRRELNRAWSSLKLEEQRNSRLPLLKSVADEQEYNALAKKSAEKMLNFLEKHDIVTVKNYFRPALMARLGSFEPESTRNFFQIGSHLDPTPLFSHFYHWFELAIMVNDPNPRVIRKNAVLYNIYDSRNEGTATAVEEIFMHAGLHDDNPRAREIVWIMLAQRAARGLGSLYAHANEMTMAKAGEIHINKTPRGWMKTEPELVQFEQHLYLRQPGYGTSYITGKILLEKAIAEKAQAVDSSTDNFSLKQFFDRLNQSGGIPISLGTWEITGDKPVFLDDVEANARRTSEL